MKRLDRGFYDRPTAEVAKELLGCLLVRDTGKDLVIGRIVETEAYDGPRDKASHASRRRTPRNEIMFGRPGFTYVYLVYGMHHCLNLVTGPEGYPAAVLIRAVEPVSNLESSTKGPGRLCRAMGVDLSFNRLDTIKGPLFAAPRDIEPPQISSSPRVGVDYAGDWAKKRLRFFVKGNRWVSAAPGKCRGRRAGASR